MMFEMLLLVFSFIFLFWTTVFLPSQRDLNEFIILMILMIFWRAVILLIKNLFLGIGIMIRVIYFSLNLVLCVKKLFKLLFKHLVLGSKRSRRLHFDSSKLTIVSCDSTQWNSEISFIYVNTTNQSWYSENGMNKWEYELLIGKYNLVSLASWITAAFFMTTIKQ